ncbi:MAG: ATP-binding cassette domain-containing protein [Candidatus Kariarchaeaceae archaeon]
MALDVQNLSIWYNNREGPTLTDISFKAMMGDCIVFSGNMGSGKSTLFWAISKLFTPGSIFKSNGDIFSEFPIIYISQRIKSQILTFNVKEELVLKLSFQNVSRKERQSKIEELVELYDIEDLINRNTRNLSSGQQQLIIILANIIDGPGKFVILVDEPLSLLDDINSKLILALFDTLVKSGNCIIIADPRPQRYSALTPTIYNLENGKLVPPKIQSIQMQKKILPAITDIHAHVDISIQIGYQYPIQRINVKIPVNGITLVVGENGSGKTTFLLTLARIINPFNKLGKDFNFPSSIYLPQDTFSFFWKDTIASELGNSFDTPIPEWVEEYRNDSPFLLSEGQRKKLALEICFRSSTSLLLDEPTQGLDLDTINWFIDKIYEFSRYNLLVIATNDSEFINAMRDIANIIQFNKKEE